MIASSSTRSVLFDVGGVLVDSHPDPLAVAALLGEETKRSGRIAASMMRVARIGSSGIVSLAIAGFPNPAPRRLRSLSVWIRRV